MQKMNPNDPETMSADLASENVERLKSLFPEAIVEGKIDFEVLKQLLGGSVDEREEKYGLNWHGKRKARQLALTPSTGTLRPCPEESVSWDTTQNLMIEGDNLEVLKLLQKSYASKVKLIYIDPPYNTGNDFIYPDNFTDSLHSYLSMTGQLNESGEKLSSNPESNGRFHTEWLNMLFPRLMLARTLLSSDGVILISIGEEELHNLRLLCDHIFGEGNFCGMFVWEKKKKPSFLSQNMGTVTDYILAYARDRQLSPAFTAGAVEDGKKYPFNNAGNPETTLTFPPGFVNFTFPDQFVSAQDMSEGNIRTVLLDDVQVLDGKNANAFRLKGEWRYSQKKLNDFVENGAEVLISKIPFRPNYVNRSGDSKKTANFLSHRVNGVPTNEDATEELRSLFGADVFSYPKPTGLLQYLIRAITSEGDLVMDFFAGSGTTGVATIAQSIEDGQHRNFILVQLPEPLADLDDQSSAALKFCTEHHLPPQITSLTKERLRRWISKTSNTLLGGQSEFGFRVFKLDRTNFTEWNTQTGDTSATLLKAVDSIKPDRSSADLLYELLLKLGLPLNVDIETTSVSGHNIYVIGSGILILCLDELVDVESLALAVLQITNSCDPVAPPRVIVRDSAFPSDASKLNFSLTLDQNGISSVRSI